ncbi:hypothetical protein WR25_15169 [Diploscapter pachys]|uniref:Serpentine receptor class gamma n=1 Tax=Diploscapter pachys TaxID=2018661 RepID=A0A2A2KPC0_9BILA|nr:hypothetical protein WR25_15169 [Diploscapter pachys]
MPRNVTIAIIVTTFTALTTVIFTMATLSRLRYIKSASVRVVEKRLLTITEILAMSLMGQFTIEMLHTTNLIRFVPAEYLNVVYLLRPFSVDLTLLSPPWIMHFLLSKNSCRTSQDTSKSQTPPIFIKQTTF